MNTTVVIPHLETDRLVLRAFTQHDLDPFIAMLADPQVVEFATYSGQTMTRNQADNWLCMMMGHWHLRGFGIWAVEERSSGELIGRIGLQRLEWHEEVELVWMLARSAWGKGFASEGAAAAVRYAFEILRFPHLAAVIHLKNQRSIKLADRLGMNLSEELERDGSTYFKYTLDAPGME